MPHPGKTVASSSRYDGRWSEIDEDFIEQLKALIIDLFAPRNLLVKKINGEPLPAEEFPEYVKNYVELFKSDSLPAPLSIFQSTVQNHMRILIAKCLNVYVEKVGLGKNNLTTTDSIEVLHQSSKNEALAVFQASRKMGLPEHQVIFQKTLEDEIQKMSDQ